VLCEPDDVKSLADALESTLQDSLFREKLINQGMARVRSEFSAAKMAEAFEAVLVAAKQG
jgi:glycosyltransferase involved in cell wall biosynthesis